MKIDDLIKDLQEHEFYTLDKAYVYINKKYKLKPADLESVTIFGDGNFRSADLYTLEDDWLFVVGTNDENLKYKCEYMKGSILLQ
jgi:hypothetical protein